MLESEGSPAFGGIHFREFLEDHPGIEPTAAGGVLLLGAWALSQVV